MHYYHKTTNVFSLITDVHTHVDKLTLSVKTAYYDRLHKALSDNFRRTREVSPEKGRYGRASTYRSIEGYELIVLHSPRTNDNFKPNVSMTLHDPTGHFMDLVDKALWSFFPEPTVTLSNIELSWDFYSGQCWLVWEFFLKHLVMVNQRSPSRLLENTLYLNHHWYSSVCAKVYGRPKESKKKEFIRLELTLKRPKIRQLNIWFPVFPDQLDLDFSRFFRFVEFNEAGLAESLMKKDKEHVKRLRAKQRNKELHPVRRGSLSILRQTVRSWTDCFLTNEDYLMKVVEKLKGQENIKQAHQRYLKPIDEWNDLIRDKALEQRFCL